MTLSPAPVNARDEVSRIALTVAYAMDNHANCIIGVALLVTVAERLGFTLRPQVVSMLAQNRNGSTSVSVVTGRIAADYAKKLGASEPSGNLGAAPDGSEFQRAGHMVAILENPAVLFDPTFGQFTRAGMPDVVPCNAVDLGEPAWWVDVAPGVLAVYLTDSDNPDGQELFELALSRVQNMAAEVAEHLRSGGSPASVPLRFSPHEA